MRKLGVNLALLAASFAICIAVIEVAARVEASRRVARTRLSSTSYLRYSSLLGWDKAPGQTAHLRRPEFDTHVEINALELRGPERPYGKPPGVQRVLLLGDSFTEGYTVPEEATVRSVLESLLSAGGRRWEVLNGGTQGYSTDQEYLFFLDQGRRYQPDVVVLLFYYNDLYGNSGVQRTKPHFVLEGDRLVLHNVPPPPPARRGPEDDSARIEPWHGSMALALLGQRTRRANPPLHRALQGLGLVEPDEQEIPAEMRPFGPPATDADEMWRLCAAIVSALRQAVDEGGGRLVVFYVPVRFEVYDKAWELTRQRYRLGPEWAPDRVVARLGEVCARLALPLIEPRPAFRQAAARGETVYHHIDAHWTAAGNAVAAHEIAAFMGKRRPS